MLLKINRSLAAYGHVKNSFVKRKLIHYSFVYALLEVGNLSWLPDSEKSRQPIQETDSSQILAFIMKN